MLKDILNNRILNNAFERKRYSVNDKSELLKYMTSFDDVAVADYVFDYAEGKMTNQEDFWFSDGEYRWSTTEIYHIEHYNLAVTDEFLNFVLKKAFK